MRLSRAAVAGCLAALTATAGAGGAQNGGPPVRVYAYLDGNAIVRTDPQLAEWSRVRVGLPPKALASSIVVGSLPLPVASPGAKGALLRVDPSTGVLVGRRATPAEALSLLAVRSGA